MEIPKCFLNEVCEATTVYKNCDRSTLERECARMFAYIMVMEKYIEKLEYNMDFVDFNLAKKLKEKGFDIPHNKHLGNTHYYWYSKKTNKGKL